MDERGFTEYWEQFKEIGATTTQECYNFIYDTSPLCSCGKNNRRFISFKDGYKEYCEKCGRVKNNKTRSYKCSHEIIPDYKFEKRDYLKKSINKLKNNNKFVAARTRYPQINKYQDNLYEDILDTTFYLPPNCKFNERLYHIENDLFEVPKCLNCGEPLDNFFSSVKGYRDDYCRKNKCSLTKPISKLQKDGILKFHYNSHKKFFEDIINEEYTNSGVSFEEYVKNRDNTKIIFTHKKCGKSYTYSLGYQGEYSCPYCYPIRSKQQFYIYDYIKQTHNIEAVFNDRKTLKGKEIDILVNNFGIEYHGQIYHSFGISTDKRFNNNYKEKTDKFKEVDKLNQCESLGISLYSIFSSEWLGPKQNIWKSMISSKLGKNKRIYARKCTVKEVPNIEAKEFLNNNHLQGNINSKVKVGLYFDNELVQIMTFGKPRSKKWKDKDYTELYRMCSRLNIVVVGGASKLLKYFERNYTPKGLISYANRRWSSGEVYKKLGFNFEYNTKPNYFYILGNDFDKNPLESRVKFQKHKLKSILENFNQELTETQNMYNNNYRKLYDCGNKVYTKQYKYCKEGISIWKNFIL